MNTDKTAAQGELLFNRLSKRYRHLKKWAKRTGTNAFRLYDRDIPEIPLLLDIYSDALTLSLYKRPYEKDDEETWLLAMKAAAAQALGISENYVFIRERRRMRHRQDGIQYERISGRSFSRDVSESDLKFRVNLSDYLDTGLFLDGRKKRALIRQEAEGKRVLDLFAYTCSASVSAVKGGAASVDTVDLSNTYLEWGKINYALNNIEPSGRFSFIRSDALQFLESAARKGSRWDIIILDPPGFSNSKKMLGTLDMKRDHKQLIRRCISLLAPGGTLYFSSSAKGFFLDEDDFPEVTVKDIGASLVDEDFRGKRTPACYALIK